MELNFFPIVPINYLNRVAKLANHHLVLAQWLTHKRYFNFYYKMVQRGDTIILDNGCNELDKSIPTQELTKWYYSLGCPSIFVVPDYNDDTNLRVTTEELKWLRDGTSSFIKDFMVVPHSISDLDAMVKMPVKYIGLNRIMEDYGRAKIIKEYRDCGKIFHLLGMHKNPIKEVDEVREFGDLVLGIDSSLPFRLTSAGKHVHEYRPHPKKMDMLQKDLPDELLEYCVVKMRNYIEWVKNP